MYNSKETANALRELRNGMEYKTLSEEIEKKTGEYISDTILSKYERNLIVKNGMCLKMACALADYYGVPVDKIAGRC